MGTKPARRHNLSALVLKALGIFGSIEMLKMVCAVVRTKLVALWIGAAGVGVISLYNSTLEMLKSFAMMNLRQSAVPAIAGEPDEEARSQLCSNVGRVGMLIGLFSTIAVIVLSPLLSMLAFDSYDYAWGFALLAPTMFATAVSDSREAILQGLGRLRTIATASLYSAIASTAVSIPLFYFFRMAAIVPVLIVFPVFTAAFLILIPGARVKYPPYDVALFRATAKSLLRLGSYLTIGVSMGFVADYALRIYLNWTAGVDTVGLFQAGNTIVKSYVGLFFTAINMEFFPRLSVTIRNRRFTSVVVSHEITLSLTVLLPVIIVFISASDLVVELLYASSFMDIVPYITVAVIGTLLRAISWCFSYVIVAKGEGKVYLFTEGVSAASLLLFSYIGWTQGGLAGLGWAYLGQFTIFTLATWGVCRYRYHLKMSRTVWPLACGAVALAMVALALRVYFGPWSALLALVPAGLVAIYIMKKKGMR